VTLIAHLAAYILTLVAVGLVFPHGFPLVGPAILLLFGCAAAHMLLTDRKVYYDVELLAVYLGLFAFLLLGIALSPELYPVVRRELTNATSGLLFIPVLWRIAASGRFDQFRRAFAVSLAALMTGIALLCLYKFRLNLQGVHLSWLVSADDGRYPLGAALQDDYNMSALGLTAGAIACGYLFIRTRRMARRWLLAGCIAILILAALLMGSRRFYVVFAAAAAGGLLLAAWRGTRGSAAVLRHASIGRRFALHASLAAALLATAAFAIGPRAVEFVTVATGGQLDRLMARLSTLMQFSATLEGSRGPLLELAFQRINAFSLPQLLIGRGFSYLTGMHDGGAEAYPHNPVVAALLHGGIVNMLLVLYVLGRASILHAGRLRNEALFPVLFFVTLAFMLISGNTLFSNQLLVMLLVMGFVLRTLPASTSQVPSNG
jgi:hypothetical protein